MDSCRFKIGQTAAQIIAVRNGLLDLALENIVEFSPKIEFGDTLLRK